MKPFRFFLFLTFMLCHCATKATELVQWQRLPLQVELHTGHERVVFVNKNVRVGYRHWFFSVPAFICSEQGASETHCWLVAGSAGG